MTGSEPPAGRPTGSDAVYTHGHGESVLRSHRWRTVENSAAYLIGRLRPGVSVLDVGCGPGTITADLAARVAPGRVVGIDPSGAAIDIEPSASAWCFATPDDRAWWADTWAARVTGDGLGGRSIQLGLATRADLESMAAGWRRWAEAPDGWFSAVHAELVGRPGRR